MYLPVASCALFGLATKPTASGSPDSRHSSQHYRTQRQDWNIYDDKVSELLYNVLAANRSAHILRELLGKARQITVHEHSAQIIIHRSLTQSAMTTEIIEVS